MKKKAVDPKQIRALLRHLSRRAGGGARHTQTVKQLMTEQAKTRENLKKVIRMAKVVGGIGAGTTVGAGVSGFMAGRQYDPMMKKLREGKETSAAVHERLVKRAAASSLLRSPRLRKLLLAALVGGGATAALRSPRFGATLGKGVERLGTTLKSRIGKMTGKKSPLARFSAGTKRVGDLVSAGGRTLGEATKSIGRKGQRISDLIRGEGMQMQDFPLSSYLTDVFQRATGTLPTV
jgi:hypothetical protein